MTKTNFTLILVTVVAGVFSGCYIEKGYQGPTKAIDEVAMIESRSGEPLELDGRALSVFSSGVAILPGEHELRGQLTPGSLHSPRSNADDRVIKFTAEAGKRYFVRGSSSYSGCVWVEESESKKVVSFDRKGCGRRDQF